jgi:uncharacterized protein (DUF1778 family)
MWRISYTMSKPKDCEIRFRINEEEKKLIVKKAKELMFLNMSDYIRFVCLNTKEVIAKQ